MDAQTSHWADDLQTIQEEETLETQLGRVGDLKVVEKSSMGYILENGIEILDTFAEMYHLNETVSSVLGENPFFSV